MITGNTSPARRVHLLFRRRLSCPNENLDPLIESNLRSGKNEFTREGSPAPLVAEGLTTGALVLK